MSNKLFRETIRQSNPMHVPPSYEEMGKTKPVKNRKEKVKINLISCNICHKPGGQLIVSSGHGHKRKYRHPECNK